MGVKRNSTDEIIRKIKKKTIQIQLFQEAKILEALKHSSIIELKEFYRTKSNKLVLILEYAENGDLNETIENQKDYFSEYQIIRK